MPTETLKQTTIRVNPDILREARFYLDTEHKSVTEYIQEQLAAYVQAKRQERTRRTG